MTRHIRGHKPRWFPRQRKALADLPTNFTFPLFNSKHALESQRRSNYRSTAAAAREIADNAKEAGATRIDVIFNRPQRLKAHQRQDSVSAVAFHDNGSGILPVMARYALSWGAGTHFDELGTIGKFGFGLPNASINQTTRVEVYTKTRDAEEITVAWRRERVPLDWAITQNNLGNALRTLGERGSGTARLDEAVAAVRAALEEWTRVRGPLA
jgi:hypothetical protein